MPKILRYSFTCLFTILDEALLKIVSSASFLDTLNVVKASSFRANKLSFMLKVSFMWLKSPMANDKVSDFLGDANWVIFFHICTSC